ncbi:hypothetical protein FNH22_18780 [Fulvivirga sp. M361]|nr:hypothetical protein FNH22_18780 [Fulvivirga sp. M361]
MQNVRTTDHIHIEQVPIDNETYYKISNVDAMRSFFMSIVSDSNHWMFIGSNGGITAGRKHAENALFPYYTDDKIIESAENTGSKSIFLVHREGRSQVWEPFSERYACLYNISRNLYKNDYGNKILFEEVNHDLKLTFRYQWNSSNTYGFVKKVRVINHGEDEVKLSVLDGIQNIMPCGVGSPLQNQTSNLVDAYKRNELKKEVGIGIFALSAIIVDKAEPSEALKANIVWSLGLENPRYLLSSLQLDLFRKGLPVRQEEDIKAEKGAYFINADLLLSPGSEKEWMIIANVNQNLFTIAEVSAAIRNEAHLTRLVNQDIDEGTKRLIGLCAAADGLQLTADKFRDTRHFSNTLFNIMRGGIFDNNYQVERNDFIDYLSKVNREVFESFKSTPHPLPEEFPLAELKALAAQSDQRNLSRLCLEYMPLKFSRRHGDPSRPWNQFSINTHSEIDGSKILDYEGNWRDIFQNWEALAHSYPGFVEGMICKFLNASTFDGYNPYRITKNGIDWEVIEPDDPWSYIGYWGDHQIIYLLKFLEFTEKHTPGRLERYFDQELFVYANVPYKIKSYFDLLKNPKDTIEFDLESDRHIREKWSSLGADSALLRDGNGAILYVNFIEKMLATVLAKMSNYIPEAGIWMNTQRPEWNDANNALVGNGVSMVTLYYLRRFLKFFEGIFHSTKIKEVQIADELLHFFDSTVYILDKYQHLLSGKINDRGRKLILDGLGQAGSNYRLYIYNQAFRGRKKSVSINRLKYFVGLCLEYLEHTIKANKRQDNLYHAYNLMTVTNDDEISVAQLSEMLEGQVAVLSSGYLSSEESLQVLDALKNSKLFREDQYSYMLYPDKDLPGFTKKNNIPVEAVNKSALLTQLINEGNPQVIIRDIEGAYHFNDNFKNANDLQEALDKLARTGYARLVATDKKLVLLIFEEVFNHKAFTGRSGTFFGYEGLGSIYWHMVSKLQLAVQECCLEAIHQQDSEELIGRLLEHYYEINQSIGIHKSPSLYGAFPTDPYSHTPAGKGAQQPGMTGQVKEDILCRFGELGVFVSEGKLSFNPCLLRKDEFLKTPGTFHYVDVHSQRQQLPLEEGSLCFTYCQIPVVYTLSNDKRLEVVFKNGETTRFESSRLDEVISKQIFDRTGKIIRVIVHLNEMELK